MSTNSRDYASYLMHSRISRIFQLLGFNRLYTVTPPETRQRTTLDAIPEDPPPLVREYPPSRQVIVPQALYSRYAGDLAHRRDELSSQNSEYLARVPFALKNPVPGYHGIPMALLIQGRGEAFGSYVHAGEEPVLTELVSRGIMEIQLEVRWPAYPNWVFRRKIPIADIVTRKPFTRLVLACNLANVFKLFTMEAQHKRVSIDHWEAGYHLDGIAFERLWLISLWHVGLNIFEAEVRYSEPHCGSTPVFDE